MKKQLMGSKCVEGVCTKPPFSVQVCQQGGPVGVQVVEVSTCWLRLISPQRTTRTEAAGGRTNQIWRNLMLA